MMVCSPDPAQSIGGGGPGEDGSVGRADDTADNAGRSSWLATPTLRL